MDTANPLRLTDYENPSSASQSPTTQQKRIAILNRKILFIVGLIIVILLLPAGLYLVMPKQVTPYLPNKAKAEITKYNIQTNGGLRSINTVISGFTGQVKEIRSDNFTLEAKNQTIQVKITNQQTTLISMPFVLPVNTNTSAYFKYARKFAITDIKKGDFLDVTGKLDQQILSADLIIKYTER